MALPHFEIHPHLNRKFYLSFNIPWVCGRKLILPMGVTKVFINLYWRIPFGLQFKS